MLAGKRKILYLPKHYLQTIIAACAETFPKECIGLLFGERTNGGIKIYGILPIQEADRTSNSVFFDVNKINIVRNMQDYPLIGTFHSHPGKGAPLRLSKKDIEDLPTIAPIVMIVSLPYRTVIEKNLRNGTIRYRLQVSAKIGAWLFHGGRRYILNIRLVKE